MKEKTIIIQQKRKILFSRPFYQIQMHVRERKKFRTSTSKKNEKCRNISLRSASWILHLSRFQGEVFTRQRRKDRTRKKAKTKRQRQEILVNATKEEHSSVFVRRTDRSNRRRCWKRKWRGIIT